MGVLPAGLMSPAAKLLGLSTCDYTKSWYVEDRAYAALNVGNPSISCSLWPTPDRQQFAFAGSVDLGASAIPVVGYLSREVLAGQAPQAIAVYMVGGPGGDIAPGLNDTLPAELSRRGYAVIKLGYSGTSSGSAFPNPDFDVAADQLRAYVVRLGKRHPTMPVVLIGESLGAQVVERTLSMDLTPGVRGVALVHPLLFSPAAALRNFARIGVTEKTDQVMTIRSTNRVGVPRRSSTSANTRSRFGSFFPASAQHLDLTHYLAGSAHVPTLLAYGEADTRIGLQLMPELQVRCPKVKVLPLARVNHTIAEPEARVIVDALESLPMSGA